jgi:SAM-dependent methyltransferase
VPITGAPGALHGITAEREAFAAAATPGRSLTSPDGRPPATQCHLLANVACQPDVAAWHASSWTVVDGRFLPGAVRTGADCAVGVGRVWGTGVVNEDPAGAAPISGDELGRRGFSDGERYQAARPDYPADALDYLVRSLGLSGASRVVDLGAGTGILTRQLHDRFSEVAAVEPSEGMRSVLAASLSAVTVMDGRDTAIPLPDDSVDAVFVAQAFHWFDAPRALAEIYRVLVPGGGLALLWNNRDESVEWVAALGKAMRWHVRQPYRASTDYSAVLAAGPFTDVARRQFAHQQVLDRRGLYQRVLTVSYISVMEERERNRVMADVAAVVEELPEPITLPYVTEVYRASAIRG